MKGLSHKEFSIVNAFFVEKGEKDVSRGILDAKAPWRRLDLEQKSSLDER